MQSSPGKLQCIAEEHLEVVVGGGRLGKPSWSTLQNGLRFKKGAVNGLALKLVVTPTHDDVITLLVLVPDLQFLHTFHTGLPSFPPPKSVCLFLIAKKH